MAIVADNPPSSEILAYLPGVMGWHDLDGRCQGMTQAAAELVGFNSPEAVIGANYTDFRCPAAESADIFIARDKLVLSGEDLRCLHTDVWADGHIRTHLVYQTQWRDSQGELRGNFCQCMQVDGTVWAELGTALRQRDASYLGDSGAKTYDFAKCYPGFDLNARESLCLYHLLRGKTTREIAEAMTLSTRTIEDYVVSIKYKLGCDKKAHIIEKAIQQGWLQVIPLDLLASLQRG